MDLKKLSVTLKIFTLTCLTGFLVACASSSFFISYPQQFYSFKNQINQGNALSVSEQLEKKGSGPNAILDTLESARLAQLAKDHSLSKRQFNRAFDYFQQDDSKAKLSLTDGGALLGSIAVNDNAFPYQAEAYERISSHHYQSLNYLSEGDIEGAMVEIRRATEEQVFALEQHHKELAKAEQKAREENVSPELSQYEKQFSETFHAASKVKNSFQNAYTFYYSGIVREANGDTNAAYIDYKKALEIYPENNYLQKDVWRLAQQLDMQDDLQSFSKYFDKANQLSGAPGNVIIFYEEGFVPAKEEIALPFASYQKIYSIAFPAYLTPWQPSSPVNINVNGNSAGKGQEIIDTHALAAKALQEGAFKRLLRQMLRINAKARLQREALNENDGGLAIFFANAYSLVSERADLRSWLSLPGNVQVARFQLPEGSHTIHLSKTTFSHSINVSIGKNNFTLIRISNPGNQYVYQESFNF